MVVLKQPCVLSLDLPLHPPVVGLREGEALPARMG